jgi:glycosyltransferase involved in cell wall biosynthesis
LDQLLLAAADLRNSGDRFLLLLAGDGHLRAELHRKCRDLDLDHHVRFLGWVPEASSRLLPNCDIFVQSSIWEAMSVVVLEAMAAGKPMVITEVGDNPYVVSNGETAITVPPSDPAALAAGLRRLLRSANLRSRIGLAARERFRSNFTTQQMVKAYEELYVEIANGTPRQSHQDRSGSIEPERSW